MYIYIYIYIYTHIYIYIYIYMCLLAGSAARSYCTCGSVRNSLVVPVQ